MEVTTVEQIDLTDSGPEDDGQPLDVDCNPVDRTDYGPENGADGVDLTDGGGGPEGVEKMNVDLTDSGPEEDDDGECVVERIEVDLTAGVGPGVEQIEVDLTEPCTEGVEKIHVDLMDSEPEDVEPQESNVGRDIDDPIEAGPEDDEVQVVEVETNEVDLTESGPEDEEPKKSGVVENKEKALKLQKHDGGIIVKRLYGGAKIERFRFLLKQGYRFRQALMGSGKRRIFEAVATSVALAVAERRDPWLLEKLKAGEHTHWFKLFMKSFHSLLEQGETLDDAWTLARRETDTRTVLETASERCDPKTFEGKARIIICSTKHPEAGITSEEFKLLRLEMKTNLAKITDIRYIPHLLECTLVPGTGYMLVICGDEITIRWVRLTLKWMKLWPGASLCMVREKKFLQSCFMSVSVPDIARPGGLIEKLLIAQNRPLQLAKWSLLTAKPVDKEKVKKLTFLIPLSDRAQLQARNFILNYQHHKLKLIAPEDRTKIGKRALFNGKFRAVKMETADIFKTIENENDGVAVTEEWSQVHRNLHHTHFHRISFYVDAASAEAIRAADNRVSFKFEWVNLVPQARASEI